MASVKRRRRSRASEDGEEPSSKRQKTSSSHEPVVGREGMFEPLPEAGPLDFEKLERDHPPIVVNRIRRRVDRGEPIRLYADGIFDMYHYGHARALEQAKKSFPSTYLIVGCNGDDLTHKYKGRTVMTELERFEALRHCRWVDKVVPFAPWVVTEEFLDEHDIDFVCHDALPYVDKSGASSSGDVYAELRNIGRFWETKRTEGISTTDLINRIISQYDHFVRRNLARGVRGEDMNVPYFKEKQLQWNMALENASQEVQRMASTVEGRARHAMGEVADAVREWSDRAEELQYQFLSLFSSRRFPPNRTDSAPAPPQG